MNSQEILCIDNFLPKEYYEELCSIVFDETSFPWYFIQSISGLNKENDLLNQFGFSHLLFDKKNKIASEYFNKFVPIQKYIEDKFSIKIKEITRYRLGMNVRFSSTNIEHFPHTDFDYEHMVFLYYLNDSDGPTTFYADNKLQVEPLANRACLFDGSILHSSSTPSKTSRRIALNINIILEK